MPRRVFLHLASSLIVEGEHIFAYQIDPFAGTQTKTATVGTKVEPSALHGAGIQPGKQSRSMMVTMMIFGSIMTRSLAVAMQENGPVSAWLFGSISSSWWCFDSYIADI